MDTLNNEVWVGAKTFDADYSDKYLISNIGRCWSIRGKKFIGSWCNGYYYVGLCNKGKKEDMQVGRLMLISFDVEIPDHLKDLPINKIQASHIDEDRTHNYLWNLCWENNQENSSRPMHRKRVSDSIKGAHHPFYGKFGKMNHNSKPILQYTKDDQFIRQWDSLMDVERELGIKNSNITACCKSKRKTAGGYVWRYK